MSLIVKGKEMGKPTEWSIRETEFLMRLIMTSKVDGSDVEICHKVIDKIKSIHNKLVENTVDG